LNQRVSGEPHLSVGETAKAHTEWSSVAVEGADRPIVSGFDFDLESELGTLALGLGCVGLTFVMIRRRQAI
jgi:hypothetical protein